MIHAINLELFLCPRPEAGYGKGVDAFLGKFVFLKVLSVFILTI
jgi:hypothetical protein